MGIIDNWQVGDKVARRDIALIIDAIEPDTGEIFVKVYLWDEEKDDYDRVGDNTVAAVSVNEFQLSLTGANPRAVDLLLKRVRS